MYKIYDHKLHHKSHADNKREENRNNESKRTMKSKHFKKKKITKYSGSFLKWTREELKQIDWRTRKLMTMHKAFTPKRRHRGIVSVKERRKSTHQHWGLSWCNNSRTQGIHKKAKKKPIKIASYVNIRTNRKTTKSKKQKWEEKLFKQQTREIAHEYKTRHNWVGKVIHWELCKRLKYYQTT